MRPVLIAAVCLLMTPSSFAQSRSMEFLRRMDANRNGRLEPSEISDRARPYLERFAREAGIRLSGSVSISQLESAARRYYERRSQGGSDRRDASSQSGSFSEAAVQSRVVRGFGPDDDTVLVPGFGPDVDIRYPYTGPDVERARQALERYDRNEDGGIDGSEAARGRWSDNPFVYDFNDDGLLTLLELAQRYARRRIAEANENRSESSSSRSSRDGDRSSNERRSDDERSRQYASRRSGDSRPDRRTYELAYSIVSRHDRNRNGNLDRPEWSRAGENISQADADRNGEITRSELAEWLSRDIQKRYDDFSNELPGWFFELDVNQDRQISMSEFVEEWSDEKLDEFAGFDKNGDGFLTEKELLSSKSAVGGTYTNEKAVVIMPAGTIDSEIVVEDDYLIDDLDVQLSITHTNDEQLNAYLIGPDDEQIELFTGVGRSDDHFDGTILDDEARERITRSRPPFRGRFLPESKEKGTTSLSHYYGKSVHGVWRLEIRTSRGDRPGMLHGWSLIVRRPDELDSDVTPQADEAESDASPESSDEGAQRYERGGGPPSMGDRDGFRGGRPSFGDRRSSTERGFGGRSESGPPGFRGGPPGGGRGGFRGGGPPGRSRGFRDQ